MTPSGKIWKIQKKKSEISVNFIREKKMEKMLEVVEPKSYVSDPYVRAVFHRFVVNTGGKV